MNPMTTTTTEWPAPGSGSSRARPPVPWQQLREFFAGRPTYWYDRVALAVLTVAAAVLSVWNLTGAMPYMDDEGTYTAQAFSVLDGTLAPYTYWYDHPPLGWIQLGALAWIPEALGLGDGTFIGATRFAVAPFFVATAVLIYLIARRLEVRWPLASLTTLVFVLSPLSLVFARRVYLDNIGVPWLLLAFYLALSPRTALWHHIGAGAAFAMAVLSKETLAIFGPALMVALLNRPQWSNRVFSVMGFLVVGGIMLAFYPLTALLRGEMLRGPDHVSLQDALTYQFMSRSGSGSIWVSGSDAAEHLDGWLNHGEYIIVGGLVAGLICLMKRKSAWISIAIATSAVPALSGAGYLPAMYIIGMLPFLALAVGTVLDMLWTQVNKAGAARGPNTQPLVRGLGATCLAAGILLTFGTQWVDKTSVVLTQQTNSEWTSTLQWVQANVPEDDTILVPYALWQDLNAVGAKDPWTVVATEKADLDPQFLEEHPEGWEDVEWIVVGPYTNAAINSHGLNIAGEALENSVPVKTFGDWSVHRVQNG